jgi:hypothetical protein
LKRTGKLVEYVKAHNPDIPLIQPHKGGETMRVKVRSV